MGKVPNAPAGRRSVYLETPCTRIERLMLRSSLSARCQEAMPPEILLQVPISVLLTHENPHCCYARLEPAPQSLLPYGNCDLSIDSALVCNTIEPGRASELRLIGQHHNADKAQRKKDFLHQVTSSFHYTLLGSRKKKTLLR